MFIDTLKQLMKAFLDIDYLERDMLSHDEQLARLDAVTNDIAADIQALNDALAASEGNVTAAVQAAADKLGTRVDTLEALGRNGDVVPPEPGTDDEEPTPSA